MNPTELLLLVHPVRQDEHPPPRRGSSLRRRGALALHACGVRLVALGARLDPSTRTTPGLGTTTVASHLAG